MRLICKKPKTTDVLIYDRVGSEFILKSLSKGTDWGILDVRQIIFNIYPSVLLKFVLAIIQRSAFEFDLNSSSGVHVTSNVSHAWFKKDSRLKRKRDRKPLSLRILSEYSLISVIRPKVVVTFVDNSRRFNILSRLYPKAKFIGVQNGFRGIEVADMSGYLCLTNFFCFGEETKRRYESAGCQIGRFIIGGSLKDGLYREKAVTDTRMKYDFCWISQYKPQRFEKGMTDLKNNSLRLLSFIEKYCGNEGKSLAIALACREKTFPYEYRFLLDVIQLEGVFLCPQDDSSYSSYKLIDQSRVAVTTCSTIGFESIARGKKVLFCNFSNDKYYDIPSGYTDGIWSLRGADVRYTDFRERVSKIYDLSETEWRTSTQEMAQYFVQTPISPLPQEILKEEINRTLVAKPD